MDFQEIKFFPGLYPKSQFLLFLRNDRGGGKTDERKGIKEMTVKEWCEGMEKEERPTKVYNHVRASFNLTRGFGDWTGFRSSRVQRRRVIGKQASLCVTGAAAMSCNEQVGSRATPRLFLSPHPP